MGKELLIITLGIFVTILPFLGFPSSWDTALFVISGISIAALGTLIRREAIARHAREAHRTESYTQTPDYEYVGADKKVTTAEDAEHEV
jgi:hypothetical protein